MSYPDTSQAPHAAVYLPNIDCSTRWTYSSCFFTTWEQKGKRTPISLGKRLALQVLATWLVACTVLSCVYKFETVTYHTERMDAISPYMMPCSSLHVLFTQNGYLTNIPRLHKEDFPRHYGAFICILLMLAGDVEIGPQQPTPHPIDQHLLCFIVHKWSITFSLQQTTSQRFKSPSGRLERKQCKGKARWNGDTVWHNKPGHHHHRRNQDWLLCLYLWIPTEEPHCLQEGSHLPRWWTPSRRQEHLHCWRGLHRVWEHGVHLCQSHPEESKSPVCGSLLQTPTRSS